MNAPRYSTPAAFKQALEQRLRSMSTSGIDFGRMATDDDLQWRTLDEVLDAVRAFLEPALAGPEEARWLPSSWSWRRP